MSEDVKTRDPMAELYHSDYLTWITNTVNWLATQIAEPDYPAHLAPNLAPLVPAFAAALDSWHTLNELANSRNEIFTNVFKITRDRLQLIKESLPTVADEPPVLAEFGIDAQLSRDRDEFYIQAKAAHDHWAIVSAEPQFAPLVADFGVLMGLFDDFVAAKSNYYTTLNAAQQAQNAVLTTRAACHEVEREIFGWYRARHKKGKDEWWTATWWGTTSSGGGGEPGVTTWSAKPIAAANIAQYPLTGLLMGCEEYEGTERFDLRIAWAKKNEPPPSMPLVDSYTDVMQPVFIDTNFPLQKGFVYYVWIRARKDGEVSDWSDPAGIEWTEEAIPK